MYVGTLTESGEDSDMMDRQRFKKTIMDPGEKPDGVKDRHCMYWICEPKLVGDVIRAPRTKVVGGPTPKIRTSPAT